MQSVTTVTGPTAEPVILQEVKNFARIDGTTDDALLAQFLTAAIESAENFTRRAFISRTLKLTLDLPCSGNNWIPGTFDLPINAFDGVLPDVIKLPHPPSVSISSVITYDPDDAPTTMSSSNYRLDSASGRFSLNYDADWPVNLRPIGAVEITYVAGYGSTSSSVPMPIKTAIMIQTAKLYDSRGMCEELVSGAQQLLQQYKIYG